MQEPKAGRRIVSRCVYVRQRGVLGARLFAVVSVGMLMALSGLIAVALLACLPFMFFSALMGGMNYADLGRAVVLIPTLGVLTLLAYRWMDGMFSAAENMPSVVPLTRANIADLPAPDSLVRACQEPAQAHEGVLLRAAAGEAQAGQEGQLLRASLGGQE